MSHSSWPTLPAAAELAQQLKMSGGAGLLQPMQSSMFGGQTVGGGGGSGGGIGRFVCSSSSSRAELLPLSDQLSPTVADFDIGVFSASPPQTAAVAASNRFVNGNGRLTASTATAGCSSAAAAAAAAAIRETGIIEKMLPTYGFIQCCDRQARLFFHFTQFDGTIEHLRVGDPVEFEMTFDKRNAKPIASSVTKITPETPQLLSEERVTGSVTSEMKPPPHAQQGRISYENRGECFFLPFGADDVEGNVTINVGDLVSFHMASDPRNGNLVARNVRLENPANPIEYRGVVCALLPDKQRGVIERADVVREIVFPFSDLHASYQGGVNLGDEVQFNIHTVYGKEVATNISLLEPGSVVFEDVDSAVCKGQVQKALDIPNNDKSLSGRIRFKRDDTDVVDVAFGWRDMRGHYTLRHGDLVQFHVATDRRNKQQRATNIALLHESFRVSDERREQGVLLSIKEHLYGFIRCVEREQNLFFHLSELIEPERGLQIRDELEFTVVADARQPDRLTAVRVRRLPAGSLSFEETVEQDVAGVVVRVPLNSEPGLISWRETAAPLPYRSAAVAEPRRSPRLGDSVRLHVLRCKRTRQLLAGSVTLVQRAAVAAEETAEPAAATSTVTPPSSPRHGVVAALKDGYGFIETLEQDAEVFFHFSGCCSATDQLQVGSEVQYQLTRSGQRTAATDVQLLTPGTIAVPPLQAQLLDGIVLRPMRSVDPDQAEYAGLVQLNTTDEVAPAYNFGVLSLYNRRECLQTGDLVTFQLDEHSQRAFNIRVHRERLRALVDSVKGQYGFLQHELDDGKKLFFHVSEVQGKGVVLRPGDQVEFSVMVSQRSGRSSACQIVRVAAAPPSSTGGGGGGDSHERKSQQQERPERVIQRIRQLALADRGAVQRVNVLRQPRGPEPNTRGFAHTR